MYSLGIREHCARSASICTIALSGPVRHIHMEFQSRFFAETLITIIHTQETMGFSLSQDSIVMSARVCYHAMPIILVLHSREATMVI